MQVVAKVSFPVCVNYDLWMIYIWTGIQLYIYNIGHELTGLRESVQSKAVGVLGSMRLWISHCSSRYTSCSPGQGPCQVPCMAV